MKKIYFLLIIFTFGMLPGFTIYAQENTKNSQGAKIKMKQDEKQYETIPAKLPYNLIYEISVEEWNKMVSQVKQEKMSNRDANIFMWRQLYKMHSWFYIDLAAGSGMQPFAAVVEENPSLILFTSASIAEDFIRQQNLSERYKELGIIGFLIPGTLEFLESYQSQGITWVNFNQGTEAPFGGPINLLEEGYKWYLKNDPSFADK